MSNTQQLGNAAMAPKPSLASRVITLLRLLGLFVQLKKLVNFLCEMSVQVHVLKGHKPGKGLIQDRSAAPPPSATHAEFFVNAQGLYIYTRQWLPQDKPFGVIFLAHGFAEHCGRYNSFCQQLVSQGFAVFALDHQGHGRSEGTRAHVEKFSHYIDDMLQYIELVVIQGQHHPYGAQIMKHVPKFIFGHSMGGLIALHTAHSLTPPPTSPVGMGTPREALFAVFDTWCGVVVSGPALVPDPKTATPFLIKVGSFLSNKLPKLALSKLDPQLVSTDQKVVDAYINDPLNYHGGMRARWAFEVLTAMNLAVDTIAPAFRWPYLICHGESDRLCLMSGSNQFHNRTKSTDKSFCLFPGMRHEILNEPNSESVLETIVMWFGKRCQVPSHPPSPHNQITSNNNNTNTTNTNNNASTTTNNTNTDNNSTNSTTTNSTTTDNTTTDNTTTNNNTTDKNSTTDNTTTNNTTTDNTTNNTTTNNTTTNNTTTTNKTTNNTTTTNTTTDNTTNNTTTDNNSTTDNTTDNTTTNNTTTDNTTNNTTTDNNTNSTTTTDNTTNNNSNSGNDGKARIGMSLVDMAREVLNTVEPVEKVLLTKKFAQLWRENKDLVVGEGELGVESPARPSWLKMEPPNKVKQKHGRVGLLHSIAHAELYAIDLSWDIVGHFAREDLPREFFDNWVSVALEEAQHFEAISTRLVELDSRYGKLPGHSGLWEAASSTKHDLLARLAVVHLIHEGRGLDTAPKTIGTLRKSNDEKTIGIINHNLEQEIGHVGYAVKWFKYLCEKRKIADPAAEFRNLVKQYHRGGLKGPFNDVARARTGMTTDWYAHPDVLATSA